MFGIGATEMILFAMFALFWIAVLTGAVTIGAKSGRNKRQK